MLQATGSALVAGQAPTSGAGPVVWVRVVRGFYFDGAAHAPGVLLAVPMGFAVEVVRLNKAAWATAPTPRPVLHLSGGLTVAPPPAGDPRSAPRPLRKSRTKP